jgi:dipeptidase D
MNDIEKLQPSLIWKYFNEILQIPRPSKKEEKIIAYLENFAAENNLDLKKDETGNILISKPASRGKERAKSVVFQSHVDMVCEKNNDVLFNFDSDPIQAYIDGEWLTAKGTTLGADNGIGVAAQLAILADKELKHGPVECLFTVDEETGLTGANALGNNFFNSKILINLDSEDEGEIYIGCAGGIDTLISLPLSFRKAKSKHLGYKISVSGLKGGHSGDDINKGYGNSNKILNRILYTLDSTVELYLSDFQGGNLRNAIPREAYAVIAIPESDKEVFLKEIEQLEQDIRKELIHTEPKLIVSVTKEENIQQVLKGSSKLNFLHSVYACPNGVMAMSHTVQGLVETSTNLASIHFKNDKTAEIVTSQRSSIETAKIDTANSIESTFNMVDAKIWHTDSYPGWLPNSDSEILNISKKSYKKLFNKTPEVKAIHAGLECGLFLEKYPDLDMISIGPTMRGVHSPDEKLHIESVKLFWDFVAQILDDIPEEEAK